MFIALAVPTTLPLPRSGIGGDLHKHTAISTMNDYQLHIKKRKKTVIVQISRRSRLR